MKFGKVVIDRSQWRRRGPFIGANIALILLVYAVVIDPFRNFLSEDADSILERRATLARYEAVAAQESSVRDYVQRVKEINSRGDLLPGASEGTVNANLQARLKTWAEHAGVIVRSIQALPAKSLQRATLTGARLDVSGTIGSIHELVRAIEGGPPLLLVGSAALIRSQTSLWGATNSNEQILEAQFDVYGGAPPKERP